MENIAYHVQALIVSEFTGTITEEEQEVLDLLRKDNSDIQDLSRQLYQELSSMTVPGTDNAAAVIKSITGSDYQEPTTIPVYERSHADTAIRPVSGIVDEQPAIPALHPKVNRSRRLWITVAAAACAAAVAGILVWVNAPSPAGVTDISYEEHFDIQNTRTVTLTVGKDVYPLQGQGLSIDENGVITTADGKTIQEAAPLAEAVSLKVPAGGIYQVLLSDGSKVIVNAESTAEFPMRFGNRRELTIKGEAYVEAAPDPNRPFIVNAANTQAQALGTSFNVNTYETGKVMVSLLKGKVKVTGGGKEKYIHDGQLASYTEGDFIVGPIDSDVLGWAKGTMYVHVTSEKQVKTIANRYFDVEVIFDTPLREGEAYLSVERNKPVSAFLAQFKRAGYQIVEDNGKYHFK
jgi:transmembrane sensor